MEKQCKRCKRPLPVVIQSGTSFSPHCCRCHGLLCGHCCGMPRWRPFDISEIKSTTADQVGALFKLAGAPASA